MFGQLYQQKLSELNFPFQQWGKLREDIFAK